MDVTIDIAETLEKLRREGSDTESVEVKSAAHGLPSNLAQILSAFANRPGGGTLILGIDEMNRFAPTDVYDAALAQQGVSQIARSALDPPVQLTSALATVEGKTVVVFSVLEADRTSKPVRVRADKRAYIRQYDGTYPLSEMEEQAFVASRGPSAFDQRVVEAATQQDLDPDACAQFARQRRRQSSVFSGWPDEKILRHTGVLSAEGRPTMAGLLSLGIYPQQFLPNVAIQASAWTGPRRTPGARLVDTAVLEGPIPAMLDDAIDWVARMTPTGVKEIGKTGKIVDQPTFPLRAVRELVANALIHRDLGPYALDRYVSLILEPGVLRISNPGGLFDLSVASLGNTDSRLRNGQLASILLHASDRGGHRVIERLGSGIPIIRQELSRAGLPEPEFHDSGIAFTAVIKSEPEPQWAAADDGGNTNQSNGSLALLADELRRSGGSTVPELSSATGLTTRQVRYALEKMSDTGLVQAGDETRNRRYWLSFGAGSPKPES
jgi:ATP-dependent DNA helicase RecG